jgi:hypothetical protein
MEENFLPNDTESPALKGLPIPLLDQTIERLVEETNISVASWFAQQIAGLNVRAITNCSLPMNEQLVFHQRVAVPHLNLTQLLP